MHVAARVLALSVTFTLVTAGAGLVPAIAVEPQAPERLITAEEAVLISISSRLNKIETPSKPTQFEKGDAIDRAGLAKFYATMGNRQNGAEGELRKPLWVTGAGLTEHARAAIVEIGNADEWGLDADDFKVPDLAAMSDRQLTARELIDLEMEMSLAVLKYARYARGGRMDPKDLSLDIDRDPPVLAADAVLDGARNAVDVAAFLRGLHPKHEQFVKLRTAYLKALDAEADQAENSSDGETVNRKRRRKKQTKLSKRLLYNMEMWRWMPENLGEVYVQPNIPEFRIRVVKDGAIIHSERIVTGKVQNKTPVFSDELETIVFRPNWGIPNSIKVKEILPKIMKGKGIESQGFRVRYGNSEIDPRSVDWSRVDIRNYHIYQPPGQRNALGLVKFLFPNKHAVYFHDTPSKYLFKKKVRAYSHGCMRVRDPMKMAAVLLGQDKGWGQSKIDELAESNQDNRQIQLETKIPVHVTYFTARADEDGEIRFVDDIYGHEKLIQLGFDGKAHTIVKEDRSLDKYLGDRVGVSEVADDAPRRSRSRNRAWMRNVWGHN